MLHNTLYRLQRGQKLTLLLLGVSFLILSAIWFWAELANCSFPMEPIVVLNGGLATLFAVYWPWKPHYADRRLKSREYFNYKSNNGKFKIGREDLEFTLEFTEAGGDNIYIYNDPPDIIAVGLAQGAGQISDIKDATSFDYSSRQVCPKEGQIVCLRNQNGNFACVQIVDVKNAERGDDRYEVVFSYLINPDGGTDFS